MEQADERRGFDSVLKQLISLHGDANGSDQSARFDRVIRELVAEREKSAVAAAVAADRLKQEEELLRERQSHQDRHNEMMLKLQKQQEEFQAKLEKRDERMEHERREHKIMQDKLLARHDELLSGQDQERKEERRRQEEAKKEERARHDQERRDALQQQERQQVFFREVIQQLQDEVKVLRHNGSAHLISGTTQGEVETPGGYKTPASSSPYSMTPLSLMMETPNKPFEDSIGGGGVVENFAAGESGSVDETDNYVENDAVEEEEPTSVMEGDQGSVVSDGIQRAKGLISFEESFLLNKSDKVGNKVECAEQVSHHSSSDNLAQTSPSTKSMKLKLMKANMKMIAGKKN